MDMFLGYDWLVKHNLEVNWKNGMIQFTRCLESCKIKHQDIKFRTRRTQAMENKEQDNGGIRKASGIINLENLPEYICPFIYLFNKKKFEKLLEQQEWDHKINFIEEASKELNAKAYVIMVKEKEALNQWLDKQLKARLIVESKLRYTAPCFYILKKMVHYSWFRTTVN